MFQQSQVIMTGTGYTRTPNAPALKDGVEAAPNVLVLEPNACATNYIKTSPPSKAITTCCVSPIRTGVVLPNMPVLGAAPKGADACTDSAHSVLTEVPRQTAKAVQALLLCCSIEQRPYLRLPKRQRR